jgi:CHAD domain-containing protein
MAAATPDDHPVHRLCAEAREQQRNAYRQLREVLASPAHHRCVLSVASWIGQRRWRQGMSLEEQQQLAEPIGAAAAGILDRAHRRVRKRGRKFKSRSVPELHRLRIEAKKLRYAAEFFQSLHAGSKCSRYLKDLRALQDDLGHLNDADTAGSLNGRLAAARAEPRASGFVEGWFTHARARGISDARTTWKTFRRRKPFWR